LATLPLSDQPELKRLVRKEVKNRIDYDSADDSVIKPCLKWTKKALCTTILIAVKIKYNLK